MAKRQETILLREGANFAIAMHPGEFLKEVYLEPLGLSVQDAAKALGVARPGLSALVHGRRAVSPEMALKLEAAFGASAESWLNMQRLYDLEQARRTVDLTKVRSLYRPVSNL